MRESLGGRLRLGNGGMKPCGDRVVVHGVGAGAEERVGEGSLVWGIS